MSRDGNRGPKLPKPLLDKVQSGGISKRPGKQDLSRKDRRKAERQAKRQPHRARPGRDAVKRPTALRAASPSSGEDGEEGATATSPVQRPATAARAGRSILKTRKELPSAVEPRADSDVHPPLSGNSSDASEMRHDITPPTMSRSTKRKLDEDDAEIAALEKKLGIKGKRSRALSEDGLDWLADGSAGESETDEQAPEDVDWLKRKRQKTLATRPVTDAAESEHSDAQDDDDDDDDDDEDDFAGFSSEDEPEPRSEPPQRAKENPYVAPGIVHGISSPPAKYVPPSLRKAASSDEEMLRQLHRQLQGKVNKVSESNLISILKEVEDIYKDNARQHVTATLLDIIVSLITADAAHPDTVLITNAAFAAALHKVVGVDFGAQLLERIVERFDHFNGRNLGDGKQPLNLLAFLSYLYNFQLVGCGLVFDYIRVLLQKLTEANTEMLLRVMRISGQQLRQDDPSALKDIVMLVHKLVGKTGDHNLSVRTKFMIETINNLKNNRVKAGQAASNIASEQTTRMKKTLGTLNARAQATEPLRITLVDINDSGKKGKWWLVGASYRDPAKLAASSSSISATTTQTTHDDSDAGYESSTPGSVNLHKLAKTWGMNTDVRRAIFISLLSAVDVRDAHLRLLKLRLKKRQMLEIPRVVLTCVGGEEEAYNPYYSQVARKLCAVEGRALRKSFQFALWGFWRELESEEEAGDNDDGDGARKQVSVRRVVSVAKFFAALVAEGSLSLGILRKLDVSALPEKEGVFVEVFLTSVLLDLRKATKGMEDREAAFAEGVRKVFTCAGAREMLLGLQRWLREVVATSEIARTKREKKTLDVGSALAIEALMEAEKRAPVLGGGDVDSEEESEG